MAEKQWPDGGKHMPPDKAAHKVGRKWAKQRGDDPPKTDQPPKHKRGRR